MAKVKEIFDTSKFLGIYSVLLREGQGYGEGRGEKEKNNFFVRY